ncbi:diguanylate cyclase [Methyloradius palustris]|uniref:Sensor domain-containing diguanylate cyclase n=1 Tax=Methyloradius palustris TaxID=2778876 RepID=A0A8D5G209_9PROT|nr:diguanylate cyclase [Methyloradius palustris]BCM24225.1 sensor domain-containing diguanylate cyclase [Methyloradius palustris]
MKFPDIPSNEVERLAALKRMDILDSASEVGFDLLTEMAAELLQLPIALVTIVDSKRNWFKSRVGIEGSEAPRDVSFCAHAILQTSPMIIEDALLDERFSDNPSVTAAPHVRFYAGFPLASVEGHNVGTFCVVDNHPRTLSASELRQMVRLAQLAQVALQTRELASKNLALNTSILETFSLFENTFNLAAVGLIHTAPTGQLLRVNPKACEILGYDSDTLTHINFQDITHPDDLDKDLELFERTLNGEIPGYHMEKRYLHAAGHYLWASLSVRLNRDASGEPLYFVASIEDISHVKRLEARIIEERDALQDEVKIQIKGLQEANRQLVQDAKLLTAAKELIDLSEQRIKLIIDNVPARIGFWDKKLINQFANKVYEDWFNLPAPDIYGKHLRDFMDEDTYKQRQPYIKAVLKGKPQHFDDATPGRDGNLLYSEISYIPALEKGEVTGFFLFGQDVTARKRAEEAMRQSEQHYRQLFQNMLGGYAYCQMLFEDGKPVDFVYININDKFEPLTGLKDVVGRKVSELVPGIRESSPEIFETYGRVIKTKVAERFDVYIDAMDMWFSVSVHSTEGDYFVTVFENITERKILDEKLRHQANVDYLTNIANRRAFIRQGEVEVARALRYGNPLSVAMLDIDYFKKVNDTYGHKTGDLVLQELSRICVETLRETDMVARMGGEEFAILFPETDAQHAFEVAERLRDKIEKNELSLESGMPLTFTISIGVITLTKKNVNIDMLLHLADKALYEAKNTGRNKVCTL